MGGLGPTFDGELRAAILAYAEQLRAIGVNINQVAKAMNSGRVPPNRQLQEAFGKLTSLLVEARDAYLSLCSSAMEQAQQAVVHADD